LKKASDEDEVLYKTLDKDGNLKINSFINFLIYLLISPYDNEKVDLLNIVKKNYGRELEANQQLGLYVTNLLSFDLI
jgi:hypothetical protein